MRRIGIGLGASVVLACLWATVGAQEKKPEAPAQDKKPEAPPVEKKQETPPVEAKVEPAAIQQDHVDITGTLDTYYQVLQGADHVGYVREVLERTPQGSAWRYNYNVDQEVELTVPDPLDPGKEIPSVESIRIRSKLDDTYGPIEMQRTDHKNGVDINSFVVSTETGRRIDVVFSASDRSSFPISAEEEIYYSRFLMFLAMRQNGKLARPGQLKANLFVPREDASLPVVEVQVEVGNVVKREYLGKKEVPVTRVTYVKPPPSADRNSELQEAFIDKYGRIVEEVTRGGVRRVLARGEEDAIGKGTTLRQGARRDPFRKDLALTGLGSGREEGKGGKESGIPKDINAQNFAMHLAEAEKMIDELRKFKEENREADGEALYQRLLAYQEALKKVSRDQPQELMRRLEELRKNAETIWGGAKRLLEKMRLVYLKVYDAFEKDRVADMETGLSELRKSQERPEIKDTSEALQLGRWISELEPLLVKARTRVELARKKLVVSGTMMYDEEVMQPVEVHVNVLGHRVGVVHEVRFVKPNRLAIINDKQYRVGDVVDGEAVRVDKIWSHGIQVSLKEETRDVGIRQ